MSDLAPQLTFGERTLEGGEKTAQKGKNSGLQQKNTNLELKVYDTFLNQLLCPRNCDPSSFYNIKEFLLL